ncbi:hypothetical protein JCM3765_002799 [Sporobolomyces pararoseus]
MSGSLKETGSHQLDITWMLSEEEISEIRQHETAGTNCLLISKAFGNGAWRLEFTSVSFSLSLSERRAHSSNPAADGSTERPAIHIPIFPLRDFDSSTYADTIFIVHQKGHQPLHIFARQTILVSASSHFKTLFKSGFSESTSRKRFDTKKLANSKDDDGSSLSTLVEQELSPFFTSDRASTSERHQTEIIKDNLDSSNEIPSSAEPNPKRIKLDKSAECSEGSIPVHDYEQLLNVINIHEIDFRTYRALIRYLHVPNVPFLPLASTFLVEKSKNPALETPPSVWLGDKFEILENQLDWEVEPCSSHSMYRLADQYDLEDLRELSLGFIVRSLTIENVAYELFSPLSLDYGTVQKPIVEFFVKNWRQVCKTVGWKAVLKQFSLGKLTNGEELMEKIFETMADS